MIEYKNILFCTDFSEDANIAFLHALDLARKHDAKLHILHIPHSSYSYCRHIVDEHTSADAEGGETPIAGPRERRLDTGVPDVAGILAAGAHPGSYNGRDAERGMLVAAPLGSGKHGQRYDLDNDTYVTAYTVHGEHSTAMTGKGNAKVAFETECARSLDSCGGYATNQGGNVIAFDRTRGTSSGNNTSGPIDVATACNAHGSRRYDFESETFLAFQPRYARNGRGAPDTVAAPLTAEAGRTGKGDSAQCVAFDTTQITSPGNYSNPKPGDACHPLASRAHPPAISSAWGVRRLTPTECERLQSFPDGWTAVLGERATRIDEETIAYLRCQYCRAYGVVLDDEQVKLIQSDSARYKELGNAVCVNVIVWLGQRLKEVILGQ